MIISDWIYTSLSVQQKFAVFAAPVLPQKIAAITAPVQRPKVCRLHRTSPAADDLQPSPLRSSSSSLPPSSHQSTSCWWIAAITAPVQQPKFSAPGILERLCWISYCFSYLIFLCRQLSFDWFYTSLTIQQNFAVLAAPVQPLMVCSHHRTSPDAIACVHRRSEQSSRSSLQPSPHQSSRAIDALVQPPSIF